MDNIRVNNFCRFKLYINKPSHIVSGFNIYQDNISRKDLEKVTK